MTRWNSKNESLEVVAEQRVPVAEVEFSVGDGGVGPGFFFGAVGLGEAAFLLITRQGGGGSRELLEDSLADRLCHLQGMLCFGYRDRFPIAGITALNHVAIQRDNLLALQVQGDPRGDQIQ